MWEKFVLPSLFFDFWSNVSKSDEKTKKTNTQPANWAKSLEKQKKTIKATLRKSWNLTLILEMWEKLVFSSLFNDLDQKSKKSDGKTNFSRISQIWSKSAKCEKSWFYHHFSLISGLKYQKVMRKQTFLTFRRFGPDLRNSRKVGFIITFLWFLV